jgi:hypothetical protein
VLNYNGIAGKKVSINGEEVSYAIINANNIEVKASAGDVVEIDYNTISSHITTLTTQSKGGNVYTLDGREMQNPITQGLYIANGKKILAH